ncbi:penicillin-insensitive murein endopeptidase [Rhodovarius crocodyli]|uniref:Penicillin-insensitive murein endopeptidase n=1 Tax=Rhodovarius crocodyli TaxID=1979269 RepID=A0A437M1I2_9PROT|nr:penicillin-insensitive murein endopeptidase [Rhodovarius crocodyli]RVT91538.1 penicillin-insensitive murein endopeptidase [Rhodovarius crocodyli]
MRALALLLGLLSAPALAQSPPPYSGQAWGQFSRPSAGPTHIIGGTGLGCIGGAVALPNDGPGWQNVRVSRNRHWGSPELVRFIESFAGQAQRQGFPALWIGDMGQPRGGPMPYGHASHQVGLDVDIWLELNPKPPSLPSARENIDVPSLVLPDESAVDPARFTAAHAALIRLAAGQPGVDRIFVNHGIKRSLCRMFPGADWLRRVRPWRGHDSHMHIRLRCPAGQSDCRDQPPVPAGDGCDASLAWWLSEDARRPAPRAPGPPPRMPAMCSGVFSGR